MASTSRPLVPACNAVDLSGMFIEGLPASSAAGAIPARYRRKLDKWEEEAHKVPMERLRRKRQDHSGWSKRSIFPDCPPESLDDFPLLMMVDRAYTYALWAVEDLAGLSVRKMSEEDIGLALDELHEIEAQLKEALSLREEQRRRAATPKKAAEKENVAPKAKRTRRKAVKSRSSRPPALGKKAAKRVATRAERGVRTKPGAKRK
ncbi:hypothetical protein OH76DRAFT_1489985 [Lentinus brumalis]|uniref:Uncharacterized protein n=1 Tax=Lentinus brumalis TaxID=2498619 RepID=A0A371CKJ6_9APHY|nr:hypothetical protein OH76DRAFT_1489985 [Polyporus brumalis]